MDNWLNRLERKFGRLAIPNLTRIIICTYILGYIMNFMGLSGYISMNPYLVMHGQVWRIFSWLLMPPSSISIWTLVMLFFYYSLGTALERSWGDFRYNMYLFTGFIFTLIGAFAVFFIGRAIGPAATYGMNEEMFGTIISGQITTYYVNMTIFLAFAASYPNMQVMLYFIIPVKIKWIAWLDGVLLLWEFIASGWVTRVILILSLLNFLIFFLSTRDLRRFSPGEMNRRRKFHQAVNEGSRRGFSVYNGGADRITRHKCALCGRTELDEPGMEFRFCSKCNGNYEYCSDHIFTHTHIV